MLKMTTSAAGLRSARFQSMPLCYICEPSKSVHMAGSSQRNVSVSNFG